MARLLHDKGYKDVWPLLGGFEAWVALGYPVEAHVPNQPTGATISVAEASI